MAEPPLALCVDFGSTWTKMGAVDLGTARLIATAAHPTTLHTDLLDGFEACRDELRRRDLAVSDAEVLACSSAGGGLRIAVIGNEPAVTVEAGRRAALSSGGQVVATLFASLGRAWSADLAAATPDLVVLSGGTDGGNRSSVLAAARALADLGWVTPVVLAGNADAVADAGAILAGASIPYVVAGNLVPQIGRFAPDDTRAAIRSLFLSHVIGGKHLSVGPRLAEMIIGPTPDVVLTATELVGAEVPGGVVVVDVGGATTDVYSYLVPDPAEPPSRAVDLVASTPANRTVEGDLGVHASAAATLAHGRAAELITAAEDARPTTLARTAVTLALGRHAGRSESMLVAGRRTVRVVGPDLRGAGLVIGSGGVFRADPVAGQRLVAAGLAAAMAPGRLIPTRARVTIDRDYRLAPIGLLASRHPDVARVLARSLGVDARPEG